MNWTITMDLIWYLWKSHHNRPSYYLITTLWHKVNKLPYMSMGFIILFSSSIFEEQLSMNLYTYILKHGKLLLKISLKDAL